MPFNPNIDFTLETDSVVYTTPLTPVKVSVTAAQIRNEGGYTRRLYWDFGDGTTVSNLLSAEHWYERPGIYTIKLFLYDSNGTGSLNGTTKTVNVYDYIPSTTAWVIPSGTTVDSNNIPLINSGRIHNPLHLYVYESWQTAQNKSSLTVFTTASGSESPYNDIKLYHSQKWSHLMPFSRFGSRSSHNTSQIHFETKWEIEPSRIYLYRDGTGTLRTSLFDIPNSFFVGLSGMKQIYYVDDTPSSSVILFANLQGNEIDISNPQGRPLELLNWFPESLKVSIVPNTATQVLVTPLGIPNTKFTAHKATGVPILVTAVVADNEGNKVINITIDPGDVIVKVYDHDTESYLIEGSDFTHTVKTSQYIPKNTAFITWLTFLKSYNKVHIEIEMTIPSIGTITGISNTFGVYDTNNLPEIVIRNENVDLWKSFNENATMQIMDEYPDYMEKYLKSILGDMNDIPTGVGKQLYAKIANFTRHNTSIDYGNIDFLINLTEMLNIDTFEQKVPAPALLMRLLDLFSIKRQHILGSVNLYDYNFNTGYNKGRLILKHENITSEVPIIAQDRFSEEYFLVNENSIEDIVGSTSVPLSSYDPSWGWSLPLPDNITGIDVFNYFDFYEWVPTDPTKRNQLSGEMIIRSPLNTFKNEQGIDSDATWWSDEGPVVKMLWSRIGKGINLF